MKCSALDDEEKKRCADLNVTLVAGAELFKKDQESSRTQYCAGDVFRAEAPDASYRKESYKYKQEAHKERFSVRNLVREMESVPDKVKRTVGKA